MENRKRNLMDMQNFIIRIDNLGWGVGEFNTYHQNGKNRCYIKISESGECGTFIKAECDEDEFNVTLQKLLDRITSIKSKIEIMQKALMDISGDPPGSSPLINRDNAVQIAWTALKEIEEAHSVD